MGTVRSLISLSKLHDLLIDENRFWSGTLKSILSMSRKEDFPVKVTSEDSRGLRCVALAILLALASLAVSAPRYALAQTDSKVPGPFSAQPLTQQQSSGAPEAAPASTPTVVLDDTRTVAPRNAAAPAEQAPKPGTRTVQFTDFQLLVATSLGQTLPIYGQNLFENVPTTFAPVDRVPVTADYALGPGDELLIRAWGQIDLDIHTRVDRNGAIYIPKVGNLTVAGLRFSQLQDFLKSHIGRIYQNFDLNVTMGELRSIDVFVVGQARRPGRYTVSSLSTLANAVFASGGPSSSGSMRHIQLKRGSTVVADFDLYDLLIKGDKSKDVLLQPEDVIYFAPIGAQVAMGGQVNNPAIYELKTEASLGDVLQLAGGLGTTASGAKVYVEQIKNRRDRGIEEVKLDASGLALPLKDGDVLNFAPISPRFVNSVTLRGNVASPGRYPWHEGMRISDLIPNREFLITREYWNQQNAINLQMQEGGTRLSGELNDVRRNAPEINWDYAVVQRMSSKDLSTELVPFNLGKAVLEHQDSSDLVLQAGDIVTIFSQADLRVPREQQTKLIRLEGEFVSAGIYRAQPAQGLRELVAQSGGLASSAYLYAAVFTRESTRIQQQERLDMVISQMERDLTRQAAQSSQNARTADEANAARATLEAQRASLDKLRQLKADGRIVLSLHPDDASVDAIPDIPLEDGDQFYVPSRPIVVSVVGDVYNQGAFIQRPGKTVSRYLRDAGGPTRNADKGRIFVVRANGAVVSKDAASGFWSGGFESMVMMPGDTVIVPEQLNPGAALRNFKDWSQILFNFGLAAAAVKVLTP
jgi:polysaccharide export outer membrane protein